MIKITDATAELKSVKTKKIRDGENKQLVLVMSFACSTLAKGVVLDILGCESLPFWRDNDDRDSLFLGCKSISSDSKVERATLQFQKVVFEKNVLLDNWAFVPRAHEKIDLSFNASVIEPNRDQRIGILAKLTKPGILEIEGELDLHAMMQAQAADDSTEDEEPGSGDQGVIDLASRRPPDGSNNPH